MTRKQQFAVIDAILKLNAAMMGDEQRIFVTNAPRGWVRIGEPRGGASRSYPTAADAEAAAWQALRNARQATGHDL